MGDFCFKAKGGTLIQNSPSDLYFPTFFVCCSSVVVGQGRIYTLEPDQPKREPDPEPGSHERGSSSARLGPAAGTSQVDPVQFVVSFSTTWET